MTPPPIFPPLPETELAHVLDHTAELWRRLDGERIFITGGTGFFGSWVVEGLIAAYDRLAVDVRATVLTRSLAGTARRYPHLFSHPALTWVEGDIRNFTTPHGTFSQIIHLASEVSSGDPATVLNARFESIVLGTRRVLDLATKARTTNLLFASSGAIYGAQPATLGGIREDAPCHAGPEGMLNAYAECKRMAETLCMEQGLASELQPKIARCFTFAGPRLPLDTHFALSDFVQEALHDHQITIKSDGAPRRSYLHAADLTIWLLHLLLRGTSCRAYNVGSEHAVSLLGLAQHIARQIPDVARINTLGSPSTKGERVHYIPCCARARSELGLDTLIPVDRAVTSTIAWYRSFQRN